MRQPAELPEPAKTTKNSGQNNKRNHDRDVYENAWVVRTNDAKNLVTIQTVGTKINIVFKVTKGETADFTLSTLTPVTFECPKPSDKCDLNKNFKIFIAGRYYKAITHSQVS